MRRFPVTLLVLSLGAHLALAGWWLSRAPSAPAAAAEPASTGRIPPPAAPASEHSALAAALRSADEEGVIRALEEAGASPEQLRAFRLAQFLQRYKERRQELQAAIARLAPYWRQQSGAHDPARELRGQLRQLNRDLLQEASNLLGNSLLNWGSDDRYNFLPADKQAQLAAIDSDYRDLSTQIRDEMAGFPLPSDQEKLRFLEAEKRRDIEALLSPEERVAYELRFSPTAQKVRSRFGQLDMTEEEYRRIYDLQAAIDAQESASPASRQARLDAEQALRQQVQTLVGVERWQEFTKNSDADYRLLASAVQRLNLPPVAADQVLALRQETTEASRRVAADPSLTPAQRQQAIAQLAAEARAQIQTTLGPEGSATYLQRGAGWLRNLEHSSRAGQGNRKQGG